MLKRCEHNDVNVYKQNLRKIIWETLLTYIGPGFAIATITVFWNSVGMDQESIGFVQMVFTVILCCFDIPMGYIADKFSRKAVNIVGDFGVALTFAIYACAQNVTVVLISECLLGLFTAMTNGVDSAFIKSNCDKIDPTGNLFKRVNVKIHTARYFSLLMSVFIGGFIVKYNLRLSIGISFIPYFIGGIIALTIKDYGEKKKSKYKNPIKDMISVIKEIVKEKKTRVTLISYIIGKEITHSQIWVFTPLLMIVGVPIEIVSMGWIMNYLMQTVGSYASKKLINLTVSKKFGIPVLIEIMWMLIVIFNTNIITVWLFALNGFVHGLIEASLSTAVQESASDDIQTSLMSIASTGARLLYIPLVYVINYLGNIQLQLALVGVCCLFVPMCIVSYLKLRKLEK